VAPTQDALYRVIDLDLSWSERELPERVRTKHVHRLHPYLGKFIPQLVEALLDRYLRPGGHVLDPFAGSGTTLVQALEGGHDATGVDVAAFNALLMRVKTARYNLFRLERELRDACHRLRRFEGEGYDGASQYVRDWYAPRAAAELLFWRGVVDGYEHADVLRVVLARAARSARRTAHFDLDFPRAPQLEEYWCHKHRRTCRPVASARQFLGRYALDTVARIKEFARARRQGRDAVVLHADSRCVVYRDRFDGILTSPPYPGLIDYHEQHRHAYELLGLEDLGERELGKGTSRATIAAYCDGVAAAFHNAAAALSPGAPIVVVINDRRDLYPEILARAGLELEERFARHVNRRTGRRAGEFYEDVLVARAS
jgi:hypothetical protein